MHTEKGTISWDSKEFMLSTSRDIKDFIRGEYTGRRMEEELAHDDDFFTDPGVIDRIYYQFSEEILSHCNGARGAASDPNAAPPSPESSFQARKNQLNYAVRETLAEMYKRYAPIIAQHPETFLFDLISETPACFDNLTVAMKGCRTVAAFVKNNFTGAEIFGWLDAELQREFCIYGWRPEHTTQLSEHFSAELNQRPDLSYTAIPGDHTYKKVLRTALTECCERLYSKHRVLMEKFPEKTVGALLAAEKQLRTV